MASLKEQVIKMVSSVDEDTMTGDEYKAATAKCRTK